MKKNIQVLAIFLFSISIFTLSSCKKCVECEFAADHGDHSHDENERLCGNKKEIKKFEEDMAAEAKAEGTTVNCHEEH
ncbi:MAG: hypothetical protein M3Q58_07915 [Bacteroidota bacterium]|nr:hypothetical protein [Bacteroidota bacterium]